MDWFGSRRDDDRASGRLESVRNDAVCFWVDLVFYIAGVEATGSIEHPQPHHVLLGDNDCMRRHGRGASMEAPFARWI